MRARIPGPMRTLRLLPLVLALFAGCGKGISSYGDAADQGVEALNEYAKILASVKDKGSAEAAKPKLEALAKRMEEILEGMKALEGPPTEDEKTTERARTAMEGVSAQVSAYFERARSNPEIAAAIREAQGAVTKQLMPLRAMLGA